MAADTVARWFFVAVIASVEALEVVNLGGEWTLRDAAGNYTELKAQVPGGVYSDLMENKIIGDVFYGDNDTATRWVGLSDWIYTRTFTVDETILNNEKINIVFEGLDTFASITLNDVAVGTSENMFLRYILDVKNVLQLGNNTIEIKFLSPVVVAKNLTTEQGYEVPPSCPPQDYRGECHVNQIRKMQASFSWDWGPAFPSMGVWKEVYLEAFHSSRIRYVLVDYNEVPNDSWLINITSYLSAKRGDSVEGKLQYRLQTDVAVIEQIVDVNTTNNGTDDEVKIDFSFTIPKLVVRRWWPNRYGEQKLYNLTAQFRNDLEQDSKTVKIGFRKIELVQDKIGQGLSFYFRVNDVPIFAKGANEIPLNVLPEKGQDPITVSRILKSAHEANMNMLRVWGGGVYESDFFYDMADELGILIWQDFMFACALYPTYPAFLNNVKAEVRHQTRRLYNHPSIAVWAGNNENELAIIGNWYGLSNNTIYKQDYIKLYIDTIKTEFSGIAKSAIFVSSSPSNGEQAVKDGYLSPNPQSQIFGDVHFYNYVANSLNVGIYPIPRFASEYGYQSLPDVETWLTATNNLTDLHPHSDFMNHRQHHPLGNFENDLLIAYQLKLDSSTKNYYKTYIYYSQIVQALSVKCETEYYRTFMGSVGGDGRGYTMGALFWQLNDVWVAPTWSAIDFKGKWKMLQYFAKNFFAPTIVTGFLDVTRRLKVYVVSEVPSLLGSSLDVSVVVDVYNWSSFSVVNSTVFSVNLEYGKSTLVAEIDTDDVLSSLKCGSLSTARTDCFFYLTLYSENTIIAPNNFVLATSLKESNIQNTTVEISSFVPIDEKGHKFEITVNSSGVSLFVWLDSHEIRGRFGENGFVQVTPTKSVLFQSEEPTTLEDLRRVMTVTHLKDPQYYV